MRSRADGLHRHSSYPSILRVRTLIACTNILLFLLYLPQNSAKRKEAAICPPFFIYNEKQWDLPFPREAFRFCSYYKDEIFEVRPKWP